MQSRARETSEKLCFFFKKKYHEDRNYPAPVFVLRAGGTAGRPHARGEARVQPLSVRRGGTLDEQKPEDNRIIHALYLLLALVSSGLSSCNLYNLLLGRIVFFFTLESEPI